MRTIKRGRRSAGSPRKGAGTSRHRLRRGTPQGGWFRAAWQAGRSAARSQGEKSAGAVASLAQWIRRAGLSSSGHSGRRSALAAAFHKGYRREAERRVPGPLLRAQGHRLTAVVTVSGQAAVLSGVLRELHQLGPDEIIVVVHGSSESCFETVRSCAGITAVNLPDRPEAEARALGARLSTGDAVLFVDGNCAVTADQLAACAAAGVRGADVVLSRTQHAQEFVKQDDAIRCQSFLNRVLDRDDLQSASLRDTPCLLSRRALDLIGYSALAVPPKAQARALAGGLIVEAVETDRCSGSGKSSECSPAERVDASVILGDHLEALGELMAARGPRLHLGRQTRRELAERRNRR